MAAPFETDEPARLSTRIPWLPLAQRAVLAVFAYKSTDWWDSAREAIDDLTRSMAHVDGQPFWSAPAFFLAFRLVALVLAGTIAARVARLVRERPRRPREASTVRADERGLHSGGRLVVAREDLARVEVTTDADVGFALWLTTRGGVQLRVPVRAEETARALAMALGLSKGLDPEGPGALVFEGVSGNRRREGIAALGAVASVALVAGSFFMLRRMSNLPTYWTWFRGWEAGIPWTFAWWLGLVTHLGTFVTGLAAARALAPIVRRATRGRVAVGSRGVGGLELPVPADAIAEVSAGDAYDATLALKDGRRVRVAFDADRALAERDLFVSRVREIAGLAKETSGVRVAREAAAAPAHEGDEDEGAAPEVEPARGRRAR